MAESRRLVPVSLSEIEWKLLTEAFDDPGSIDGNALSVCSDTLQLLLNDIAKQVWPNSRNEGNP